MNLKFNIFNGDFKRVIFTLIFLFLSITNLNAVLAAEISRNSETSSAETSANENTYSNEVSGNPNQGPDSVSLYNPLGTSVTSIPDLLLKIIDIILVFAIPLIVLYIMYAGFLFVTARGDTSQIDTAKRALLWALVGGVIILGAKVILEILEGTVDDLFQ